MQCKIAQKYDKSWSRQIEWIFEYVWYKVEIFLNKQRIEPRCNG